jgi:hypothetical protein
MARLFQESEMALVSRVHAVVCQKTLDPADGSIDAFLDSGFAEGESKP